MFETKQANMFSRPSKILLLFLSVSVLSFLPIWAGQRPRPKGEPINVGLIFSIPWDLSNTLRAPLGGPLSLVLAGGLGMIAFYLISGGWRERQIV